MNLVQKVLLKLDSRLVFDLINYPFRDKELYSKLDYKSFSIVDEVKKNGFMIYENFISDELCDEIQKQVFEEMEKSNESYKVILNINSINEFMNQLPPSLQVQNLASLYINTTANKIGEKVLFSKPTKNEAAGNELWHVDKDDTFFFKFFIYLTDTNEDNGAHIFVKQSHKFGKNYHITKNLKKKYGIRYSDEDIDRLFKQEDIITHKGKKGTAFFEDTTGIHKGPICEKSHRIIYTSEYAGNFPYYHY